jgi:hypothetical protein
MSYESPYFWVVLCKNHKFHNHQNLFFGHRIPLGETDPFHPPPNLHGGFEVCCDECGHKYTYKPKDLLRVQMEPSDVFSTHPLFL